MQTLTLELLKNSGEIDDQFTDLENLVENPNKVLASFGHENPFSLIPELDQNSVQKFLQDHDIDSYSTPPWVTDGQFLGLTVFWKKAALQKIINANLELLTKSMWPRDARGFGMKVNTTLVNAEQNPELYGLIAQCFDDRDNPFFAESK